jgi:hypothetical protein
VATAVDETIASLEEWGLAALGQKVWTWHTEGVPLEEIKRRIRESPEHAARYPGFSELQKKGRGITEGQWIDLERAYVQVSRKYGIPAGFYDSPDDFGKMIVNEKSPAEFDRTLAAYEDVYRGSIETASEFGRLYGIDKGGLLAYFIDPDRAEPVLLQQGRVAAISGTAIRSGFGALNLDQAERLESIGMNAAQAEQAFGSLAAAGELFNPLDAGEDTISRDEQISAVAGSTAAQQRIQQRKAKRRAVFDGSSGFGATEAGVTGLGSASS